MSCPTLNEEDVHAVLILLFGQTIFFWILLVRQIMQYYDAYPEKSPKHPLKRLIHGETLEPASINISDEEQMQIKDIFDLFDTDGGGSIDGNEMDAAMFALGFRPAPSKVKESGNDAKQSQPLTLDEFTALMKGEIMIASPLDAIWAAFSELSQSGAEMEGSAAVSEQSCRKKKEPMDVVTLDGLKRACLEFDVKLSDEELKDMMDEADGDGGGYVDRNEFMSIMHNTPWF
jgi:centrin-1